VRAGQQGRDGLAVRVLSWLLITATFTLRDREVPAEQTEVWSEADPCAELQRHLISLASVSSFSS